MSEIFIDNCTKYIFTLPPFPRTRIVSVVVSSFAFTKNSASPFAVLVSRKSYAKRPVKYSLFFMYKNQRQMDHVSLVLSAVACVLFFLQMYLYVYHKTFFLRVQWSHLQRKEDKWDRTQQSTYISIIAAARPINQSLIFSCDLRANYRYDL